MRLKLVLLVILSLLIGSPSWAEITFTNGYWSSTFNCSEQDPLLGNLTNFCDGIGTYDRYTADPGGYDSQIITSANYSSGGGGLGYRHWLGTTRNDHSTSLRITFPTPQQEIYVRWYMRWQSGFAWTAQRAHKVPYFATSAGLSFYWMIPYTEYPSSSGMWDTLGWLFNGHTDDYSTLRATSGGWYTAQGNSLTADGGWDCYEVYIRMGSPGTLRTWVNGVLVHSASYDMSGTGYGDGLIHYFYISNNHDTANNASAYYEDIDDIAIALPTYTGFVKDSNGNNMIGLYGATNPVIQGCTLSGVSR